MALTDDNGALNTTMLVSPTGNMGGYPYPVYQGNGSGNNGFGQDGWWIILLIIIIAAGGWGNNNGNGGNGGFGGQPIIVNDGNSNGIQRGFDQAAIMAGINGVQTGVQNLSTQLCGCCGDMQMALANGFAGVEQGANARQIANMQQAFAAQAAVTSGMNGLAMSLQNCCCENKAGIADLKYTVATENCADRTQAMQNTRDIIDSQTRGTQAIIDKLCQLELDGVKAQVEAKNDRIAELQTQLNMANLAASQTAQNAFIAQGFANEVDQLYTRLSNCPVPSVPVYGRQNIFQCNQNSGCGCGCGNGSF